MHKRYPMAAFRFVEVGGGGQNGDTLSDKVVEDAPEVTARYGIHPGRGLVEQNHFWVVNQRADQAELLLHTAGEFSR